jgi:cytochrome oxidase Cu insertion factor (SCO1/SenC/PrrC family)
MWLPSGRVILWASCGSRKESEKEMGDMRMLRNSMALLLAAAALTASAAQAQQRPAAEIVSKVKVGDMAPDFTLNDHNNNPVKLSDFRGEKNVVLAFYVLAFTGG